MYYYDSAYLGMHSFWWLFWIVLLISFFSFLRPVPGNQWHQMRETPKEILQRRLARGEITTHEYENRKAILDRDEKDIGKTSSKVPRFFSRDPMQI